MTTAAFASLAGPTARAMAKAFELATAGQMKGTFPCPRCRSTVTFTALIAHQSSGKCNAACGVRWSQ